MDSNVNQNSVISKYIIQQVDRQQNQMHSNHHINLRSYHSLKSSTINQFANNDHMNPLSSRLGLMKKTSAGSKVQLNTNQSAAKNHTFSQQAGEIKLGNYQSTVAPPKNQLYITLGSKNKDNHLHQSHSPWFASDLSSKVQQIINEMEKQNKRLASLQSRMAFSNSQKQQILAKINSFAHHNYVSAESLQSKNQLKIQISLIKNELGKMMDKKEAQKRIQAYQMCIREATLNFKKNLFEQTQKIENRVEAKIRKQIQRMYCSVNSDFSQIFDKISRLEQDIVKIGQNHYYQSNSMVSHVKPLLANPNLKLKFMSKISLIEPQQQKNPQNDEQVCDFQQWVVQQHIGVYMVDKQGYLLDQNQRYILNCKNQCVRLNPTQISMLMGVNTGQRML